MKIYQVPKNLHTLKPIEVNIVKKTDTYYWDENGNRHVLNTTYVSSFDSKEDALKEISFLISMNLKHAKSMIEHYKNQLQYFYKENGIIK